MIRCTMLALLTTCTFAACAGSPNANGSRNAPGGITVSGRTVFETLPPQNVSLNQCPLVLYSRADESRRLFIALDNPALALIRIDGRTTQFARTATSGATSHRHYEEETYSSPDGAQLTASVRFTALPENASGAAIRSASLSYTSPEGETAILPAVGLASCPAGN